MYDAVQEEREIDYAIGTGDFVSTTYPSSEEIRIELPPLEFVTARDALLTELESAIRAVFVEKDKRDSGQGRAEGLASIQTWIDEQGGSIDVRDCYEALTT